MERGRKKGTCVLLSSQQFVCMLERLLDSMTTHGTVKSTCTHGAVVCLCRHFKDVTSTALSRPVPGPNEGVHTLSGHTLVQDLDITSRRCVILRAGDMCAALPTRSKIEAINIIQNRPYQLSPLCRLSCSPQAKNWHTMCDES